MEDTFVINIITMDNHFIKQVLEFLILIYMANFVDLINFVDNFDHRAMELALSLVHT